MKLKYYLRGLGIGIIVTTIVLTVSDMAGGDNLTDEEIIERAEALGMVMEDENGSRIIDQIENNTEESQQGETEGENQKSGETTESTQQISENIPEVQEPVSEQPVPEQPVPEQPVPEQQPSGEPETTAPYMLVVNAGQVCRELCDELQQNGVITDSEGLRKYLGDNGYAREIRPGNYEIPYGSSYEEIAQILLTEQ